jgi:uncharacterized membrane protein
MTYLIAGLILFLGVHSVRIVADDFRTRWQQRLGEGAYKGLYSAVSLLGFVLIVWGFGLARETPVVLWSPPAGMRHVAALLTLFAFVLLAASYVPHNYLKARLHHPMVLSVKVWALAHLLSNGNLAHVLLFGSFLAWSVVCFSAARRRDRAQSVTYPAGTATGTAVCVVVGAVAWGIFAMVLHGLLVGVRPMG